MANKDFEFNDEDFDYELDTDIDKYHLDRELECQHSLFSKYSKLSKKAKEILDDKHELVKTLRSKIILRVKGDDPKATGQVIEAEYRTDKDYMLAKKAMIKAEYQFNVLDGNVMSLHQRKASLSGLIKLYLNEYWADAPSGEVDSETQTAYRKHKRDKVKQIIKKKSVRKRK